MKEFKELGLKPELVDALRRINFVSMTEVQESAIPVVMQHKDVIVRSKTGSGKTGAFLVPIFQMLTKMNRPQAIVIVPTRELALQVSKVSGTLGHGTRLNTAVVYGGASINVQIDALSRGVDIVVGTPGRILDLMERGSLRLNNIKFLVLDEADLMLDMGFIEDIESIIASIPHDRQTMLFSATMPREIHDIARRHMKHDVVKLTVGAEEDLTVNTIVHNYFIANGRFKFAALLAYIEKFEPKKCIIFTSTKHESDFVNKFLVTHGFDAIIMHGGLTQAKREHSLHAFKTRARFLISTNLASRGLDIQDVTDVINFDAPDDPKIYVHRVGRSARMGKNGRAFTMYGYEQKDLMNATMRMANIKMQHIDLDTAKFKDITLPERTRRSDSGFGGRRPRGNGGFNRSRGRGGGGRYGDNRESSGSSGEGSSGGGGSYRGGGYRSHKRNHY